MTNEELILRSVGEIVERLVARFSAQASDHEAKMVEHRAAFGARTEADRKIIAGLREESAKCQAELDDLYQREGIEKKRRMDVEDERDALRAEVAALQERLRASIARGDFAQMEVAALKSQTPNQHGRWVRATSEKCTHAKAGEVVSVRGYLVRTNSGEFLWEGKDCEPCDPPQTAPVPKRAHPVAVGGHLRRLTGFNTTPAGEVARVTLVDGDESSQLEYEVVRPNGQKGRWSAKGCEPCDPPEATHDTEAGKASAEAALKTEPVAKGDLVKVFQATGSMTVAEDIGSGGVVHKVDGLLVWLDRHYTMDLPRQGVASLSDVRKVTT